MQILGSLRQALPLTSIYVSNLYDIPGITDNVPGGREVVLAFNNIVAGVAPAYGAGVADVFSRFEGRRGLLLIERRGASSTEVHPSNAGYRVMKQAFQEVAAQ